MYDTLFLPSENDEEKRKQMKRLTTAEMEELELHKEIHLSNKRRCCLYIIHSLRYFLRNCCCNCISTKYSQLLYLKDTVKHKVVNDLDMVTLIRRLRELQVLIDNSKIDKSVRFKIDHSYNNIVNLEDYKKHRNYRSAK